MDPNNIAAYNTAQMHGGYPQYQQDANIPGPNIQRAANQYLGQLQYANMYNHNLMYQQQYQLEAQNQQLAQIAQEREDLQRQLMQQRQFAQARQRRAVDSRQKEKDALAMLAGFQKSLGGNRSDPLSLFENTEDLEVEPRGRSAKNRYNDYPLASRDYYNKPPTANRLLDRQYGDQGGYGYNQGQAYQSPFQNAANLMINPMSPGQYQPMFQQAMPDPYGMQQWGNGQQENKKEPGSRTAEILMASLEKQNQILSELTETINKDRDHKVVSETKEIEDKIKQMEFESQAKHYQLFSHNTFDALSRNYNRPIHEINLQKHSSMMPGSSPNLMTPAQLLQMQGIMGPNRLAPMSVMPSEMMKYQKKLEEKREKDRKREKKKKNKLKELLLLLGEDDGEEEQDEVVQMPVENRKRASGVKEPSPEMKALNAEKEKLKEEKRQQKEEAAKKKRINKLRAHLWLRLYPLMYYVDFYDTKTEDRKQVYATLSERIGTNMENTKIWAQKAAAKGLEMITGNSKLNVAIVSSGGKKLAPKDLETRTQEIQKILKTIMDGLINNTKAETVPAQLLSFLGDISQNYCYPPQNYLFAFEVNRLNFTHNASLKETTPAKTQMICCLFMLIRMFIAEMLLQPEKMNASLKPTEGLIRNVKTFGSIMTIVITDYLNSRMTIQHQNQKHLDPELVIKPRSAPIEFKSPVDLKDDAAEEETARKKEGTDSVLISGLYTKEQLSAYFGKKPLVDEFKALIEGWCNSIAEIVTNHHLEEVKAKHSAKKK